MNDLLRDFLDAIDRFHEAANAWRCARLSPNAAYCIRCRIAGVSAAATDDHRHVGVHALVKILIVGDEPLFVVDVRHAQPKDLRLRVANRRAQRRQRQSRPSERAFQPA